MPRSFRQSLPWWIGDGNPIGGGISQTIKKAATPVDVTPPLGMQTFWVVAHVEKVGPCSIVDGCGITRTHDMSLTPIAKFILWSPTAPGTPDQKHQCATAAAAASLISRPVENRLSENGAAI